MISMTQDFRSIEVFEMRVYISGKSRGTKDDEKKFTEAEKVIMEQGHQAVKPLRMNTGSWTYMTCEEIMAYDLSLLRMCDAIYMLMGWQSSCKANREYGYALGCGKKILTEPKTCNNCGNHCNLKCNICKLFDGQECYQDEGRCRSCSSKNNWISM